MVEAGAAEVVDSIGGARYRIFEPLATGGMATVHLGERLGPLSYRRPVAIKRLHRHLARDPDYVAMQLDEARLSARLTHANLVSVADVIVQAGELALVMEYVHGVPLSWLRSRAVQHDRPVPSPIAARVVLDVLSALDALHEAQAPDGRNLGIVHRDVSPQNVLVGADGVARLLDLGIAKAAWRAQTTQEGERKGKPAYMAPEQLEGRAVDQRADLFAVGVVLWELLANARMHDTDDLGHVLERLRAGVSFPPSDVPDALRAVVQRAVAWEPAHRFERAEDMARALEQASPVASSRELAKWVSDVGAPVLDERSEVLRRMALSSAGGTERGEARAALPALEAEVTARASASLDGETGTPSNGARPVTASAQQLEVPRRSRLGVAALVLGAVLVGFGLRPVLDGSGATGGATRGAGLGATVTASALPRAETTERSPQGAASEPPGDASPAASGPTSDAAPRATGDAPTASEATSPTTGAAATKPNAAMPPAPKPAPAHPTTVAAPKAAAKPAKPSSSACSPPFEMHDGVRVYKEQCL